MRYRYCKVGYKPEPRYLSKFVWHVLCLFALRYISYFCVFQEYFSGVFHCSLPKNDLRIVLVSITIMWDKVKYYIFWTNIVRLCSKKECPKSMKWMGSRPTMFSCLFLAPSKFMRFAIFVSVLKSYFFILFILRRDKDMKRNREISEQRINSFKGAQNQNQFLPHFFPQKAKTYLFYFCYFVPIFFIWFNYRHNKMRCYYNCIHLSFRCCTWSRMVPCGAIFAGTEQA